MSKNVKTERQDDEKQKPIQNFPDYLKYVARRSKAGFDKVHEEIYRIYSDSFSKAEKQPTKLPIDESDQKSDTIKSKTSLRSQWAGSSKRSWSSTGFNKAIGNSFISYIPEDLGSITGSDRTYKSLDLPSDEYDIIKQESKALHDNGTCSASICDKNKKVFDFDSVGISMPHAELTKEVIYANDRVLHVENFTSTKLSTHEEVEEDPSVLYSFPIPKHERQNFHEDDDYVNLRTQYEENNETESIHADKQLRIKFEKDRTVLQSPNVSKQPKKVVSTANKGSNKLQPAAKRPLLGAVKEVKTDNVALEDDNDYLPPSEWNESYNDNTSSDREKSVLQANTKWNYIRNNVKQFIKSGQGNSNVMRNTKDRNDDLDETDDYYVTPSTWRDPDYVNVSKETKVSDIHERLTKQCAIPYTSGRKGQTFETEDESTDMTHQANTGYDYPRGWIQTNHNRQNPTYPIIDLSTNDIYATVVKSGNANSPESVYSVPVWPSKPVKEANIDESQHSKMYGNDRTKISSPADFGIDLSTNDIYSTVVKSGNTNSPESDYSVPVWPSKPVKEANIDEPQHSKMYGNDRTKISSPADFGIDLSTNDIYATVVKSGNTNSPESDYSVPVWPSKPVKEANIDEPQHSTMNENDKTKISSPADFGIDLSTNDIYASVVKSGNTNSPESDYSVPVWPSKPVKEANIDEPQHSTMNENDKTKFSNDDENADAEFYKYSVDEVVKCLNDSSIGKLAKLCEERQLNGQHFRSLTKNDLKRDPYNMNWFHISRLFKVINGWRPKTASQSFKRR